MNANTKADEVIQSKSSGPSRKRRRRMGKVERAGHLASWDRSGLSGGEYGRLHGLKATDLYRWRKLEKAEAFHAVEAEGSRGGFLSIDVEGVSRGAEGLKVVFRQGSLEVEASGAPTVEELVGLAGRLRREVLDA
jgi:hypothetical protein